MTTVETRPETGLETALNGATEVFSRRNRIAAAQRRGDYDAVAHERLALAYARSDQERHARYDVPVEPEPALRTTMRPPRPRRDRRLKSGHPRRRSARSSARAGPSGDDPELSGPPPGRPQVETPLSRGRRVALVGSGAAVASAQSEASP